MIISVFDRVENIVGKGKIAHTSNFSFSHNVFERPRSLSLFILHFTFFSSMKILHSPLPVKLQKFEILSKDEKAL